MAEAEASDAFIGLTARVLEVARQAVADRPIAVGMPSAAATPMPAGVGGVRVTGEQPDILSKAARLRLVADSKRLAASALGLGAMIAVVIVVLDATISDADFSGAWAALPAALVLASVLFWLVAYLTVMGFGKVTVGVSLGDASGVTEGGSKDEAKADQAGRGKAREGGW